MQLTSDRWSGRVFSKIDDLYFKVAAGITLAGKPHILALRADSLEAVYLVRLFRADEFPSGMYAYDAFTASRHAAADGLDGDLIHLQRDQKRSHHTGFNSLSVVSYQNFRHISISFGDYLAETSQGPAFL